MSSKSDVHFLIFHSLNQLAIYWVLLWYFSMYMSSCFLPIDTLPFLSPWHLLTYGWVPLFFRKSNIMLLCHMYTHSLLPTSLKIVRFSSCDPFSCCLICIGTCTYFIVHMHISVWVVCMHVCVFKFLWCMCVCEFAWWCHVWGDDADIECLSWSPFFILLRVLPLIPEIEEVTCLSSHFDQTLLPLCY